MKATRLGTDLLVEFTGLDAHDFASEWPGCEIEEAGWFRFDKNGNLIDIDEDLLDGPETVAFSEDCYAWGVKKLAADEAVARAEGNLAEALKQRRKIK